MAQHLWFIGDKGTGKSTQARTIFMQSPADTKVLSGQTTLNAFASLFRQISIPSQVIIDIDDEEDIFSWASILNNATTSGHMVHTKGMRWRLKIPPQCRIVVFSTTLSETWRVRLSSGRSRFLFTDLSKSAFTNLPHDCPVTPLGLSHAFYFYKTPSGRIVALSASSHSRLNILGLFEAEIAWLYTAFPRGGGSWKPEIVGEALMQAAAAQGPIDPSIIHTVAWSEAH